jgi:cytosine/adenosine deaminase-related metal-dependent hydrolase
MVLKNLNIIGRRELAHIQIRGDKIQTIIPHDGVLKLNNGEQIIEFDKAIAFPGLINSHDHLEFNLFPQLGNTVYKSYIEWGADISKQNKEIIDGIVKIPEQLRVQWGIYKNLLNGFTTVIHHGKYFKIENPLITIFQDCYSLHSVGLEKKWKFKLNKLFAKDQPYVIHAGEGTDKDSFEEISELIRWNFFKRKLIAIHGVSMNTQQAKAFDALIWCPDSNFFLLNKTARIDELKKETAILFGTDSTVSANWNLWEQIRLARKTNMLGDDELLDSLTSMPANVWGLKESGVLSTGKNADIVIAKMKDSNNSLNSFFLLNPEDILLIVKKGEVILFDHDFHLQLKERIPIKNFTKVFINKMAKFVAGPLHELINQIKKYKLELTFPIEIE